MSHRPKLVKVARRYGWFNPDGLRERYEENRKTAEKHAEFFGVGAWVHDHADGKRCNEQCVLYQPDGIGS
jgi:hypothetical protein